MTRHIRLPLGSTTTETHCGDCEHVSYARSDWLIDGLCYQAYECRLTGESLQPGPEPIRTEDCRAAEVKDEPPEPRHKCRTCGVEPVLLPGWVCSGCALY